MITVLQCVLIMNTLGPANGVQIIIVSQLRCVNHGVHIIKCRPDEQAPLYSQFQSAIY